MGSRRKTIAKKATRDLRKKTYKEKNNLYALRRDGLFLSPNGWFADFTELDAGNIYTTASKKEANYKQRAQSHAMQQGLRIYKFSKDELEQLTFWRLKGVY
jgi:hypothetical protein